MSEESTTPDLVELVREAAQAMNRGDLDLAISFWNADCRVENAATAVTDNRCVGWAGLRKWYSDIFDAFAEGARFEVEEILAITENFVVARVAIVGQGVRSGAPLQFRYTNVYWFSDGKITRGVGYNSRREALSAVGLEG